MLSVLFFFFGSANVVFCGETTVEKAKKVMGKKKERFTEQALSEA